MKKVESLDHLKSFLQSHSTLKAKVARITLHQNLSLHSAEKVIVILAYLQLLLQILDVQSTTIPIPTTSSESFADQVIYTFKICNPAYLVPVDDFINSYMLTVMPIVFCFTIFKLSLLLYIIYIASKSQSGQPVLTRIWRWLFRCQTRVLCFFTTSFCLQALLSVSIKDSKLSTKSYPAISIVMIVIEYLFSIFIETQLSYVLPSKSFLSSKNCNTQVMVLTQKLTMQILRISLQSRSLANTWIVSTLSNILSLIGAHQYFSTLPLYKFKALLFQGCMQSILVSLNLVCLLRVFLMSMNYERADNSFLIVIWVILAILMIQISRMNLRSTVSNLLINKTRGHPELLLHKVIATNELSKRLGLPGRYTEKYNWIYLLNTTLRINIKSVFGVQFEPSSTDNAIEMKKEDMEVIFIQYLENLSTQFPGSSLVKLHLAQIYSKRPELYSKLLKIVKSISRTWWSTNHVTSSLLLYKAEDKIIKINHSNSHLNLDLLTFIRNKVFVNDIKSEILKQIELKIKVCNNIIQPTSDIGEIYNSAQLIYESRKLLLNRFNLLTRTMPESFLEPLLLYAEYHLALNNSVEDYIKYKNLYAQKYSRHAKNFDDLILTENNLYRDTNALLILSAQGADHGQIKYANKAIQAICGDSQSSYIGKHFSSIFPKSLQDFYTQMFRQIFEVSKSHLVNKRIRTYLSHKAGYLVEVDCYVKIHPYITENLYLSMIIRPVPPVDEYMIVKENGDIDEATKRVSEIFGIRKSNQSSRQVTNVKQITNELDKMNKAYNMMINKAKNSDKLSKIQSPGDLNKDFLSEDTNNTFTFRKASEILSPGILGDVLQYETALNKSVFITDRLNCSFFFTVSILKYGSTLTKLVNITLLGSGQTDMGSESSASYRFRENKLKRGLSTKREINEVVQELAKEEDLSLTQSENIKSSLDPNDVQPIPYLRNADGQNLNGMPSSPGYSQSRVKLLSSPNTMTTRTLRFTAEETQRGPRPPQAEMELVKAGLDRIVKDEINSSLLITNPSVQSPGSNGVYRAFQAAVSEKSSPRLFNVLCFVFYAVVLATLFCQVSLKVVSDQTMAALVLKGDLLSHIQFRTYYASAVMLDVQAITVITAPELAEINAITLTLGALDLKTVKGLMKNYLSMMIFHNNEIIRDVELLDEVAKRNVYSQNVYIYGSCMNASGPVTIVTNFEAVNQIINAVYTVSGLTNFSTPEAQSARDFLRKNLVNDFFTKTTDMTNFFIDLVKAERAHLENMMSICLMVPIFLLLGIVLVLTFIIWSQYTQATKNMSAFIRVDSRSVNALLNNIKHFKKCLTYEDDFSSKNQEDMHSKLNGSVKGEDASGQYKKRNAKVMIYSQFRVRYYKYVTRIILLVSILVCVTVWNYASAHRSIKVIYRRQNQLQFVNFVSIIAAGATYTNMFISNDTIYIDDNPPSITFAKRIDQLKYIITQAPSILSEEDNTYDPAIKVILFGKYQCEGLDGIFDFYCRKMLNRGQRPDLMSAVTLYENLLTNVLTLFRTGDKRFIANLTITATLKYSGETTPVMDTILGETQKIAQIVSSNLTQSISGAHDNRTMILCIFSVLLVITSILIWFQILMKIREGNNDFKKVLQVFPVDLILSSSLLKDFLKRTSTKLTGLHGKQKD